MDNIQIYQAINEVSKKINDLNAQLSNLIILFNKNRMSDIDYIAMETGIDLDQENENIKN